MTTPSLYWQDYLILAAFLMISLGIGFYHSVTGGRQKTTQEFIMANRKLGILPTAISLFVSFQSAITILGNTVEMYQYGVQLFVWTPVSFVIAILLAERLVLPWIYPLKLVSINDYLEQRYESKAVRVLGSILSIIGELTYVGFAMYAPSTALETATGLPISVSVPLMAFVSVSYTALGGMRAVIWTDVFQFATIVGGLLAVLIVGVIDVGGFGEVFEICDEGGRLKTANWSPDPRVRHTVWGFLFGFTLSWFNSYGLTQASVQRYSATSTLSKARVIMLLNIPAILLSTSLVCLTGLTVFAYYSKIGCDPLVSGQISSTNQLLPLYVITLFKNNRGFSGLFLATLYGGALSSVSSSLSGAAANCWDDILKSKLSKLPQPRQALINRFLVVIFGVVSTSVAFLADVVPGPLTQIGMAFGSIVSSPILGLFLLGGISRHTNKRGALVGGLVGLCINCWLIIGAMFVELPPSSDILPPVSIDGCVWEGNNGTTSYVLTTQAARGLYHVTESYLSTSEACFNATVTQQYPEISRRVTINGYIYGVSYIWNTLRGVIVTSVVGLIMSLIFRDKDAKARVSKRLLIPFHLFFRWTTTVPSETESVSDNDIIKTVDPPYSTSPSEETGEVDNDIIKTVDLQYFESETF